MLASLSSQNITFFTALSSIDAPSTDALKLKKLAETSRRLLSEKCAAYDRLKGRAEAMEARLAGSEGKGVS